MPWQAHLYIGQPVATYDEVADIYAKLGVPPATLQDPLRTDDPDYFFGDDAVALGMPKRKVIYRGVAFPANPTFLRESEAGDAFPANPGERNTFAMVAFPLTSRYRPAILDVGNTHGRPDPFVIDLMGVDWILKQTREWWPLAEFLVCDIFH